MQDSWLIKKQHTTALAEQLERLMAGLLKMASGKRVHVTAAEVIYY